jgi:hypothetical protein
MSQEGNLNNYLRPVCIRCTVSYPDDAINVPIPSPQSYSDEIYNFILTAYKECKFCKLPCMVNEKDYCWACNYWYGRHE